MFSALIGLVATATFATATPTNALGSVNEPTELTHQEEVWLSALEWCESRGDNGAVNPKDRDGTPSYYAYQFKPTTFDLFSKKYGVSGNIKDYKAQRQIVAKMIHDETVDLSKQFPDCVKNHVGYPPK